MAKKEDKCAKGKPDYSLIIGKLMQTHNESQERLAAAIGVTRDRVNNWLLDRSKLDVESLIKIADHYGVTTDYVLGKTGSSKDLPTLRAAVEITGLSEKAVLQIANATGSVYRYCDDWDEKNKPDFDKTFNYVSPLDEDKVIVLDDLISEGDGDFFAALFEVRRIAGYIEDLWADWKVGETDVPPLSWFDASRLFKDLRHALFDLTEEARDIANSLYNYDTALEKVEEIMKAWYHLEGEEMARQEDEEIRAKEEGSGDNG